jgi:DNA ligase-1
MFKPMLASKVTKFDALKFPLLASIKLDGIRATVQGGQLLSRTLKPLPNKAIQALFAGLPEGLDGELILGDPAAPDCFRKTSSKVMSPDEDAEGIVFHVFDKFAPTPTDPFTNRSFYLEIAVKENRDKYPIHLVFQTKINSLEMLEQFEEMVLAEGHEGVMLRSLNGPYKQGRSSEREGYLLKLKRFQDGEAEIIGVEEQMHNDNEAETNELGRTKRSTKQEGMIPAGVLGALNVRDLVSGVEFDIGTGFDADERAEYWKKRKKLTGLIAKYKYFATGGKDKPRFPVFDGFRDKMDIGE